MERKDFMTDPLGSFPTNFGRFYAHPSARTSLSVIGMGLSGPRLDIDPYDPYAPKPSVTNVIGMLDKRFLPPYYAKLVATYAVEHLESLQNLRDKFGPEVAIGMLKAVPNAPNPSAAIGDEVHAAIDALVKGEAATPLTTTTAVAMFAQFVHFLEVAKPEIIRSEFTVWSYKYGFAGTGDLMWKLWGQVWIVDTKTGKDVHPEVGMQTVAISKADVILDADGNESPMPPADTLGVVHVRPRSVKLHKLERTEECFRAFLALKQVFDWKRFDAELVIQDPFRTEKRAA